MTAPDALIGHTGFVGGTLTRQTRFDTTFNSSNIEALANTEVGLLVCSGAPAEKWKANRDPATDRQNIGRLMDVLRTVRARFVILISTVDVYPSPAAVDEDTVVPPGAAEPYGRHRRELEQLVEDRFEHLIVRLPGLFGRGLKKNIVYDLLNDNMVDHVHPDAMYQFYNLEYLWRDISTARGARLQLVNLATEPTSVGDVARIAFGRELSQKPTTTPARYDVRSRHAALFGGAGGYLYSRERVLADMAAFVVSERTGRISGAGQ